MAISRECDSREHVNHATKQSANSAAGTANRSTSARENDRLVKLQHFLVMKAFNLRKGTQTLQQQFNFLKKNDGNQERDYLNIDELCEYLSIPPFRRLILCQVFQLPSHEKKLDFNVFLRFLQSTVVQAAHEEKELKKSFSNTNLPVPPPSAHLKPQREMTESTELVWFQPTLLSSQTRFSHPPPAPGLWKKREITIQERITEYTKIDEQGRPQNLIEKEKHQTEIIHMESLNGEFAHREITHFEQTEHLNDEIVHHEHGREEFLHLKSQHDEISRFESSIPTGSSGNARPEECEQGPPSPSIKRDPSTVERDEHGTFAAYADRSGGEDASLAGMSEEEYYEARVSQQENQDEAIHPQYDINEMQE